RRPHRPRPGVRTARLRQRGARAAAAVDPGGRGAQRHPVPGAASGRLTGPSARRGDRFYARRRVLAIGRDHDDRAVRVPHDLAADGAHHQFCEPARTARSDYDKIRVPGFIDEFPGRIPADRPDGDRFGPGRLTNLARSLVRQFLRSLQHVLLIISVPLIKNRAPGPRAGRDRVDGKHRERHVLERRLLERPFKGTGGVVRPIDTDNDSGHFLLLLTGYRPAAAATCSFTVPSIRSFLPGTKV